MLCCGGGSLPVDPWLAFLLYTTACSWCKCFGPFESFGIFGGHRMKKGKKKS